MSTTSSSAELSWSDDGRPRSERFDDIYFAPDGLDEARTVFLRGCGLPEAWAGRRRFTVAELGFGTGLNILATLQLWRKTRPGGGRLHLFSVEAHPLSPEEARRALASFPELADLAGPLLAAWPGRARGFERIESPELGATLDVATLEVAEALARWSGLADAWFLDGFAPSRNPDMWRPEVLDLVRARSAPDARLATFAVAGAVRRGLEDRGFVLARAPGHGRKRERLEGRLSGAALASPSPRVAVIGAGIAGAGLARAFDRLGLACTLLDPTPGGGASGNPVALVSPRLDAGESPAARLHAQAFARAVDLYAAETPDAVARRGALRLAVGDRDPDRFARIAASEHLRPGALRPMDPEAAGSTLGEPAPHALWMTDALTVTPAAILERWTATAQRRSVAVHRIEAHGDGWHVLGADGELLAEADVVCLAAGIDAVRWLPPEVALEPVRGQASWTPAVDPPGATASWGGYVLPLPGGGLLFGATHGRGVTDTAATPADDRRNLAILSERLPRTAERAAGEPLQSRASLRAATPDRLPLAGAVPNRPGLYVLGGLGGRGFTTAPLLAEHVAAQAADAPSPLPRDLAEAVDPARFAARARRRAPRAAGARS